MLWLSISPSWFLFRISEILQFNMKISFVKGKRLSNPTWSCVEKVIALLVKSFINCDQPHLLESLDHFAELDYSHTCVTTQKAEV